MARKFTPGPWTTDPSQSFYVKGPDGSVICNANTQANQALIREAPELAAALEAAKVAMIYARDYLAECREPASLEDDQAIAHLNRAIDDAAAVLVNAVGEG